MIIILMGVTGCGKTTVGRRLCARFGLAFHEGDALHPEVNVRKMAAGVPLDDWDRRPWLQIIRQLIEREVAAGRDAVIACSALKVSYRDVLRGSNDPHVQLVYLEVTPEVARSRLESRTDHFMPPELVDSQFAALEPPADALRIDASLDVDSIVQQIAGELGLNGLGSRTREGDAE
jgi:gluconokinase